jgi:hypothetical protein
MLSLRIKKGVNVSFTEGILPSLSTTTTQNPRSSTTTTRVSPIGYKNWSTCIDGQVRLVCLQTDNFHLFLCQQKNTGQTFLAQWANGKHIKENCLGFHFLFSIWNGSIYLYIVLFSIYICIYSNSSIYCKCVYVYICVYK